jgi:hypothetical protein
MDDLVGVGAMIPRTCRRILIASVAVAAALVPLSASAAVNGLAVSPAHPDPANPATRSYFVHDAAPGDAFTDQVKVTDGGTAPLELVVSAVDGLTGQTSGAVYANRQDPVGKAGAWVQVAQSSLKLKPATTSYLNFTVHVPKDALPGDHLAGIAFEDAHPTTSGSGLEVTTVLRAVVGVQIRVSGAAAFHLLVGAASIEPLSDTQKLASVKIRLQDDGLLLGKPRLTVRITGPNGYHGTVTDRPLDTLLPGDPIDYPLPWPDPLAPGDYVIDVSATGPGMADAVTHHATFHLDSALQPSKPDNVVPSPPPAPPAQPGLAIAPWVLIAGVAAMTVVLLIMLLMLVRTSRRGRRARASEHEVGRHRH